MAKSPDAFRTISEVSDWLGTPAHVLRFWESRFSQVKPVKRAGGRRYYRPGDMALLSGIRRLLHEDGITIKGVQKILKEKGVKYVSSLGLETLDDPDQQDRDQPASVQTDAVPTDSLRPHSEQPDTEQSSSGAKDQEAPAPSDSIAPPAHEETPVAAIMAASEISRTTPPPPEGNDSAEDPAAIEDEPKPGDLAPQIPPAPATGLDTPALSGDASQTARIVALYRRLSNLRDRVAAGMN